MPSLKFLFKNITFRLHPHAEFAKLPEFPQFKKLEISDKENVEKITNKYPPYSDFNFVSMWSWDIKGQMRISELNGNLVVLFTDYVTGEPFYSFLGDNKVNETAEALLQLSKEEGLGLKLNLIPEDSIRGLDMKRFKIQEERDHFDYIFDAKSLFSYSGPKFKVQRNQVHRFKRNHKFEIQNLNLADPIHQKLLLYLVELWVEKKKKIRNNVEDYFKIAESENESLAFKKLLSGPITLLGSLMCFALFIDGNLSGFIVNEKISKDYCLSHFGKADTKYEGIYQFLIQQNTKTFLELGVSYLNHEQDLGIKTLRSSKESYNPVHFLKKYTISF